VPLGLISTTSQPYRPLDIATGEHGHFLRVQSTRPPSDEPAYQTSPDSQNTAQKLVIVYSAAAAALQLPEQAVRGGTINMEGVLLVGHFVTVRPRVKTHLREPRAQRHVAPLKLVSTRPSETAPATKYLSLDLEDFQ
jgi:hypothetical protein